MKNDIFNFRRFGKYFSSDLRTCSANFGLTLVSLALIVLFISYFGTIALNLVFNRTWEGPELSLRVTEFIVTFFATLILAPSKCYGKITEKQYGSFWLTLPASRLEKFTSMAVITAIIIPLTSAILYLCLDTVICALDPTCGDSIIASIGNLTSRLAEIKVSGAIDGELIPESAVNFMRQIGSPWLYLDDFIGLSLPFLLGAVFFKKHKIAKTFLAIMIISTVVSAALTPFMESWARDVMGVLPEDSSIEFISDMFNMKIFKHVALWDTISDTIVNVGLLAAIYFRIKTLKH